jgi:hypothetical protein
MKACAGAVERLDLHCPECRSIAEVDHHGEGM